MPNENGRFKTKKGTTREIWQWKSWLWVLSDQGEISEWICMCETVDRRSMQHQTESKPWTNRVTTYKGGLALEVLCRVFPCPVSSGELAGYSPLIPRQFLKRASLPAWQKCWIHSNKNSASLDMRLSWPSKPQRHLGPHWLQLWYPIGIAWDWRRLHPSAWGRCPRMLGDLCGNRDLR